MRFDKGEAGAGKGLNIYFLCTKASKLLNILFGTILTLKAVCFLIIWLIRGFSFKYLMYGLFFLKRKGRMNRHMAFNKSYVFGKVSLIDTLILKQTGND